MSNIDKRELRHSAESIIVIMEGIAGFEPSDIDGDSVELRFETEDGFDTGCDVSIVDQCQKASDVVLALLDELEAAEKRIAELEAREISLPERSSMLHRTDFHEDYQTVMAYKVSEVIDAIRAAGIRIKGGAS